MSSPEATIRFLLTLGWLTRCVDLWRTRLVVIRDCGETEMRLLRRFAHRLAAQGGPAVWLVDGDCPDLAGRLRSFYNRGPGCLSPMFASAREHRRLTQKGVVVDLLHEEIRYIGARD
jgi:hypothetical protein